ncbi:CotH kinase family protein [Protaetiibacter intestinalis]|nr:CotH kinase family protein [Protaetiibacter intestinalis]
MIVLIPAYEPGDRLAPLVAQLRRMAPELAIVVVDDGSGPAFRAVFDATRVLGAQVLTHPRNLGKAAALRTGLRHALEHHPGADVVTADSDGQHTAQDILRVAERLDGPGGRGTDGVPHPDAGGRPLVLGARTFGTGTPARSRFGNAVSTALFGFAAGYRVRDTQTGLRGIPAERIAWMLEVPGERFAYELEVLLACRGAGVPVVEVPIETVYLERNAASHFRPLRDSALVMRPLLRYLAASFAGFLVDVVLLQGLVLLGAPLLAAVVGARLVSGSVNFVLNRRYVFRARAGSWGGQALRYAALATMVLGVNYLALAALTSLGVALLAVKVTVELVLFLVAFAVQRVLVFARRVRPARAHRGHRIRRAASATVAGASVLVLAGCAVASGSTTTASEPSPAADADLWDTSLVHEVSVDADDAVLEGLVSTYLETGEKDWAEVNVTIDGTTIDHVGIKLKGNSSLRRIDSDTALAEIPWIIRLDKYVDEQSYQGETELVVRGNDSATSLNEAVALGLLRAAGLAAENATAVRFSVGDGDAALRLVIENPTGAWAEEEFGAAGQLYKAESGGDEEYHGDDPDAYADSWDQEGGDDELAALISFLRFVNESDDATFAAELAEHLDVDAFARYLAFQDLVSNTDDIDGPGNNWYLYVDDATGVATVVTWDLNLALGGSNGGNRGGGGGDRGQGDAPRQDGAGGGGRGGGSVLRDRFLDVPAFAELYAQAAATLQAQLVDSGVAAELVDDWQQTLDAGAADLVPAATVADEADAIRTKLGIG